MSLGSLTNPAFCTTLVLETHQTLNDIALMLTSIPSWLNT